MLVIANKLLICDTAATGHFLADLLRTLVYVEFVCHGRVQSAKFEAHFT